MSVGAARPYAPAARSRRDAIGAGLLEDSSSFQEHVAELSEELDKLASTLEFDPNWERDRLAQEVTIAHDFLAALCTDGGAAFMADVERFAPDLLGAYDRARMSAGAALRAHAAACAITIGTDAALRQVDDRDLDAGAKILAKHNPLFAGYTELTDEHRELLDALSA